VAIGTMIVAGVLGLIVFGLVAGFVAGLWEQRRRKKNKGE